MSSFFIFEPAESSGRRKSAPKALVRMHDKLSVVFAPTCRLRLVDDKLRSVYPACVSWLERFKNFFRIEVFSVKTAESTHAHTHTHTHNLYHPMFFSGSAGTHNLNRMKPTR